MLKSSESKQEMRKSVVCILYLRILYQNASKRNNSTLRSTDEGHFHCPNVWSGKQLLRQFCGRVQWVSKGCASSHIDIYQYSTFSSVLLKPTMYWLVSANDANTSLIRLHETWLTHSSWKWGTHIWKTQNIPVPSL